KADWYVWADPASDGSPPNNWQSIFGGPAWRWEPRRQQYYLHNFLDSQPDLNFHQPEVPAGPRRRRPAAGCDQLLLSRPAAARQPAEARGAAQRPGIHRRQPLRLP